MVLQESTSKRKIKIARKLIGSKKEIFSWPLWFTLDEEGFLLPCPGFLAYLGKGSIPSRYWLALGEGEFFLAVKMNQLWKMPIVLKRNNEHESKEKNIENEELILALKERRLDLSERAAKICLLELKLRTGRFGPDYRRFGLEPKSPEPFGALIRALKTYLVVRVGRNNDFRFFVVPYKDIVNRDRQKDAFVWMYLVWNL
ncbi:hypothetical protein RhiirB3_381313 [Rhizophagus irregularis]|nr:hypothetical protein RhiirB3_381313 [Rhizophagus irregularis]